jgi:hypothetical protein
LHEDEAEFGSDLKDEFAVALGVGRVVEGDELVSDGATLDGEIDDAGAQGYGRASGTPGGFGIVQEVAYGFADLGSVFGDDADFRTIDDDVLIAYGRFDDEVLLDGKAAEFREFEEDGAEAVEQADEVVGVAAANGDVGSTEFPPGKGDGEVEFFVADAAEKLGVGGGTASAESDEGAALAEEAAEVEGREVELGFRFVHGAPGPQAGEI